MTWLLADLIEHANAAAIQLPVDEATQTAVAACLIGAMRRVQSGDA